MQHIQCFFYEIRGGQCKSALEFSIQSCIPVISAQSTDRGPFHNIHATSKYSCAHCTNGEKHTSERSRNKVLLDSVLHFIAPGQTAVSLPHGNKLRSCRQATRITDVFPVTILVIWIMPAANGLVKVAITISWYHPTLMTILLSCSSCNTRKLQL